MTRRIFLSIALVALAVFAVTLGLHLSSMYGVLTDMQRDEVRQELEMTAHGMEQAGPEYLQGLNLEGRRLTLIAPDGAVLYDSTTDGRSLDNHLTRAEISEALSEGYGESDRYSATLLHRSFYAARLLPDGNVLRVSATHDSVLQLMLGMQLPTMGSALLALLLSFLLAEWLARKIVRPLNELNLEEPLANQAYPELSKLLLRLDDQQRELKERQLKLLSDIEAQEQDAMRRREFTANVSHELKTPLQSISGYSELLQAGMVPQDDAQHFGASIYHEAQRLIQLVSDLLSLSQLDEGAQGLPWETVDVTAMLWEIKLQLANMTNKAGVEFELEAEQVAVRSIRPLLRTLLVNLCDNAIKYNVRGGTVRVTLGSTQTEAIVTVADTGIGIPRDCQSRVFERFYRVDKSRSRAAGGTGLGLSIVKHAARVLGAHVNLNSREGHGTTITVHLPR